MGEMATCDGQSDAMGSLGSHRAWHEDQAAHQHKYQREGLHLQL